MTLTPLIVRFARNENTHDVKWVFSNELIEGGISKAELQQKIIDMVTNDDLYSDTVQNVQRALGYIDNAGALNTQLWEKFVEEFTDSIDDFVEIQSSFPNIVSALGS